MNDKQAKVLPVPVDWDELYPGRFLKAGEFKGQKVTLRIASVRIEELIGDKGPQVKGVIAFEQTEKQWALNKTNGFCLREMFGRKVQEWVGKRVTLFAGMWDGEECIRVWGSPDIANDMEVTVALPRKRPFKMPMHKMLPKGAAQVATPKAESGDGSATVPSISEALAKVREAKTLDSLASARKTIWGLYAAAREEVPIDIEAAANYRREELEAQL
jgi:hypothetical protein